MKFVAVLTLTLLSVASAHFLRRFHDREDPATLNVLEVHLAEQERAKLIKDTVVLDDYRFAENDQFNEVRLQNSKADRSLFLLTAESHHEEAYERNLFFQGATSLGPLELASEVFQRVFVFILDYFILGPLIYYWAILAGAYNWYPDLNACLLGPPPFEQCLKDSGLKQ